jgi:hypothetical protein
MLRFDREQIVRFLHALDSALEGELKIFVVGGLAAIVKYNATVKTSDMDVFAIVSGRDADLTRAAHVASEVTGIVLSIGGAPITDLPWNYEDRLKTVRGLRFQKLTMIVPDKYDLALSKAVRGYEHDLEAIASMHKHHRLSEKTLVNRYESELRKIVPGDERNFALNMVQLVQLLYGKRRAEIYEKRWGLDKPR